jgi:hypothetical protein
MKEDWGSGGIAPRIREINCDQNCLILFEGEWIISSFDEVSRYRMSLIR